MQMCMFFCATSLIKGVIKKKKKNENVQTDLTNFFIPVNNAK